MYPKSTEPIFSGRSFNYHSQHSITQKRGVIMNLTDKVFLSHLDFHKKIFSLINILLDSSYLSTLFSFVLEKDWLLKSITVIINLILPSIPITKIISSFHMSSVHLKCSCNTSKIYQMLNCLFLILTN